jgi:hypothetical protein
LISRIFACFNFGYVLASGALLDAWLGLESLATKSGCHPKAFQPNRLHQTSIYEAASILKPSTLLLILISEWSTSRPWLAYIEVKRMLTRPTGGPARRANGRGRNSSVVLSARSNHLHRRCSEPLLVWTHLFRRATYFACGWRLVESSPQSLERCLHIWRGNSVVDLCIACVLWFDLNRLQHVDRCVLAAQPI